MGLQSTRVFYLEFWQLWGSGVGGECGLYRLVVVITVVAVWE